MKNLYFICILISWLTMFPTIALGLKTIDKEINFKNITFDRVEEHFNQMKSTWTEEFQKEEWFEYKDNANNTYLDYAFGANNKDLVMQMIESLQETKSAIDITDEQKRVITEIMNKVLNQAAIKGYEDIVNNLLTKGVNIESKYQGYTPLLWAVWKNQKKIVEILLNKGANVNAKNLLGVTPLYLAAYNGNLDILNQLLNKKPVIDAATTEKQFTPLLGAIDSGINSKTKVEIVKRLLDAGADQKNAANLAQYILRHYIATPEEDREIYQKVIDLLGQPSTSKQEPFLPKHKGKAISELEQKLADLKTQLKDLNRALSSLHAELGKLKTAIL